MIRRAGAILRDEGIVALFFRFLGETVYRRVLLLTSDLRDPEPVADDRCRWLTPDEAAEYAECHRAVSVDEVKRRCQQGQRCWILRQPNGAIAHGLWAAFGSAWIDYLQMDLALGPREAYLYQSFTPPEHRGHGYATIALSAIRAALKAEDFERTVGCIQPDRAIAYPPVFRNRSRPFGYLGWVRVGAWRWTFRRATDHFPFYAPARRQPPSAPGAFE